MSAEQLRFDVPPSVLAHADDVETSHEAAAAHPGERASHRRACLVQHEIFSGSGLIDDEVATFTGFDLIEARRRCSDLRNLGLIEWLMVNGKPLTRVTDYGRPARVSVITPAGRKALA